MAKLLQEEIHEYRTLYEYTENEKKSLFVEGIFLQANIKNRNGRVYPKHIMDKEVSRYMKESVAGKRAYGELNHPSGPTINLDRVSHLIVDLKEDGDNYIGKAKILDTPMGLIAKNIIEGGGQLAVSSRGIGSLKKTSSGYMEVQEDFMLATAADLVSTPSAPSAYVDAILEAPDWVFDSVKNEWMMKEIVEDLNSITMKNLDEGKLLNVFNRIKQVF